MPVTFVHRASFPLAAPRRRAFRALVEPAQLERWFAEHASVDLRCAMPCT